MAACFAAGAAAMGGGGGGGSGEFNRWRPPNSPRKASLPSLSSSPPGLGSFKPPYLGFGERVRPVELNAAEKASMLDRVRGKIGSWRQRAKDIWQLQQMGMTAEELYQDALVTSHLQTLMVVAGKVYDSLEVESSPELFGTFSDESKISTLYALRTLSVKQRKAAAEYVVEKELDPKAAEELARAIKGHESRPQEREGFLPLPGDCLALMHYRAATESSEHENKLRFAQKAMEAAVSESARAKITKLLEKLSV